MSKPGKCIAAVTAAACAAWAAGLARAAEEGLLKPAACDPANGLAYPSKRVVVLLTQKAAAETGTTSPKAVFGTKTVAFASATGGRTVPGAGSAIVSAAADYLKSGAAQPDAVRIAFGGSGKFAGTRAISLRPMRSPREGYFRAEFGPAAVPLEHNGKTYLMGVRGVYYSYSKRTCTYFAYAAAVQGTCRFGKKARAVRFLDMTGNLRFDDPPPATLKSYSAQAGDVVLIDTGDGKFGGSFLRAYYGQSVFVDGAWYRVAISADGTRAAAVPVNVSAGTLTIPAEKWEVALVSNGSARIVTGGKEPVAVPAGDYQVLYYRQWSAPDDKGRRVSFQAGLREWASGSGRSVTVPAGGTRKLDIAAPIRVRLTALPAGGGSVRLGMSTPTTSGGLSLRYITPRDGWVYSRQAPPKLRIRDAAGQVVDTVTLEYG